MDYLWGKWKYSTCTSLRSDFLKKPILERKSAKCLFISALCVCSSVFNEEANQDFVVESRALWLSWVAITWVLTNKPQQMLLFGTLTWQSEGCRSTEWLRVIQFKRCYNLSNSKCRMCQNVQQSKNLLEKHQEKGSGFFQSRKSSNPLLFLIQFSFRLLHWLPLFSPHFP